MGGRLYFNPHPREEGDFSGIILIIVSLHFNPRPREEGDLRIFLRQFHSRYFNPRPREEGDKSDLCHFWLSVTFQSTPS